MPKDLNALTLAHEFIARNIRPGDFCIDATAGRGRDTVFLCGLVRETGRVLAFDIQPEAVESTRLLMREEGCGHIARVIQDSHANIGAYAEPGSVSGIVFNLGWLPGGDHGVFTNAESTIAAIKAGLELLKPGGIMSICVYYGRDCGYSERDALLDYFPSIDPRRFTVIVSRFVNRTGDPAIPVFILKE